MSSLTTNIGGTDFTFNKNARTITIANQVLYTQSARAKLNADDLIKLTIECTKKQLSPLLDFISMRIDDPEKLEDTLNIQMTIDKIQAHLTSFDCHDIFNIIMNADELINP